MSKRVISLLLAFTLILSCCPVVAVAAEETVCTLEVSGVYAEPGSTVEVNLNIKDNPGILGATLTVSWDEGLTLVDCKNGEAFSELTMVKPSRLQSGCKFVWYGTETGEIIDGSILKLFFKVSSDAADADVYGIRVSYEKSDIADADGAPGNITLKITNGTVYVITYKPGDVNSDERINPSDLVTLAKYISDGCITDPEGYNVTINESAADVNDDGKINPSDLVNMAKYISDGCITDPDGYNVELLPSTPKCSHTMEHISYKAASCTEEGNISYYHCTTCNKYYNDSDGTAEIALTNTVLAATGHTAVTDPYVAPTYDSVGWTEGSHCSTCGKILEAQEEIPMLELNSYYISYSFTDSDPYLKGLVDAGTLVNNNPTTYTEQDSFSLQNLSVEGYIFEGWFDGQGDNATQIKTISNQTGNLQLYAHWSKVTYKVIYDSPDVDVYGTKLTGETVLNYTEYTIDTGATLKNPEHFGYTFIGWSLDGKIVTSIPAGTVGPVTLHANWTSDRNKAVAVSKYENPIILEDMVNGQYLFIYEIGTIQNVPLDVIKDLGNTEGITIAETYSYTQTVNERFAQTIAQTITNATTTTSSWTLSEDWNDTSSATTERGEEVGKTKETRDSQGNVIEGKYYISNVEGGATSNTSSAGGSNGTSSKVTEGQSAGISGSYSTEHTDSTSTEIGVSASVSASYQAGPAASRVTVGGEISGHYDHTTSETDKQSSSIAADRSKSFTSEENSTSESHWDTSNTNSSSWNTTESYESATSASITSEISNAISESIYNKYGYSSMIERGGENSKTASTGESMESSNEYSSTVEYSYGEEKNYSELVTRQSSATGYYRLVSAGTVHVFAVVGYDIATNSYYTYTYNILDTERHVYLDYSMNTANFNDCENAILPFEVPYNVHEFISGVISRSEGLRINETTGVIEAYSGNAEYVVIPEYVSVSDGLAEPYAVRVTGISSDAFAGNTTVKGVYLPKYVSKIPDRAFAGCASLEVVMGYGVSEIGAHAFDGCINLNSFTVDKYITTLGEKAFGDVPEIKVNAANETVADAAIKSGANKITLDVTGLNAYDNRVIEIPETTEYFALIGNSYNGNIATGITYKNLCIDSHAEETFISNMIFADNRNTPLTIASKKATLSKVEIKNAPGFALIMTADDVELDLYGTVSLLSASGNAVISKNVTLARSNANVTGVLNLTGNYLVFGEITNTSLLTFTSGKIQYLTDTEYNSMLTSSLITFHPNGGEVSVTEKRVSYGQLYGELPTPTRTGYAFAGWYTEKTGGVKVTAETKVEVLADQTLYAHWEAMAYNVSWTAGTGYTVTVNRTASPYANAATGELRNGDVIYYGDVLSITYTESTGYTISDKGSTSVTVTGNVTASDIHATADVNAYTANWNTGTGYTITVKRTSSPLKGASTGTLSSGAIVYYGDKLEIVYTKADYYTVETHGITSVTVTGNVTAADIYATAKLNEVSDWARVSDLPAGAQVVDQKWTYTLTTNKESTATSMDGYIKVGSYWVESGSGSKNYASFPSGFDTGNQIYTSFDKNAISGYENETNKRVVSNNWSGYVYWHWMYDCGSSGAGNRAIYNKYGYGPTNGYLYKYFGAFTSSTSYTATTGYCNNLGWTVYCDTGRTSYADSQGSKYWFRFDYYTSYYTDYYKVFQYQKQEEKESTTPVTVSDTISNVQEWVQYRPK